jgi:predicted dehydrogenase
MIRARTANGRKSRSAELMHRVAQIGCGQKGTSHARSHVLVGRSQIVAAADPDEENLALFCERFDVPGYTDHRELLAKEEFDMASAILNPRNNPGIVIDCAQAGGVKAIQSEKPIAERLSDADAMVAACKSNGVWYACGDVERNWSYYWKAREILESGELGEVLSVTCFSVSARRWDVQGLSLMRMFAFDADVAWLTGWVHEEAVSDYDTGGYSGHLRFTNGIDGYLHRRPGARNGIEVVCTKGVFECDHRYMRMRKADDSQPYWSKLAEVEDLFPEESFQGITVGEYDDEGWRHPGTRCLHTVESLIEAVEKDIEPRGNGDNGRKTLEMTIALRESHRRGHVPVRLPLEDRDQIIILGRAAPLDKKESEGRVSYMEKLRNYTR